MNLFFNSIFREDSAFMLKASRAAGLVVLNLLWLLCTLPVLTAGPATAALHYCIFQFHAQREDRVVRPFFRAFRREFKQGILLGLPVSGLCALLVFNGLFLYGTYPDTVHPLWIPLVILVAMVGAVIVYGFPLLARYRLTLRQVVTNSLAFLLQRPLFTLGALGLYLLPVILLLTVPGLFYRLSFAWILLGESLTAYILDRKLLKLFETQQEKEEDSE